MRLSPLLSSTTLIAAVALGGCATSTLNYTPPTASIIQNTKLVSRPFDETWDKLVKQLSSDFFVINNIDKNSRLINLSFTSQKPSDFANCGRSIRTFNNAHGEQKYDYVPADSAAFSTTNKEGIAFNVRRVMKLEGRTNIYVAPEGNGTLITVNTKYVLNGQISSVAFDGRPGGTENITWDFSTKQGQMGEVQCYATGEIERRILSLVGE